MSGWAAAAARLSWNPVDWCPSSRLILRQFVRRSPFDRLHHPNDVGAFRELAAATNPAALAAMGRIDLVAPADRVVGEGAGLIMPAFTFPGQPSRFTDGSYGVYYAAASDDTAVAETRYHQSRRLAAGNVGPLVIELMLLHADLRAPLADLRGRRPSLPAVYHPTDYAAGQALGAALRPAGAYGIVYDGVRDPGGTCAAVFRPRALSNCRPARAVHYHWDGAAVVRVGTETDRPS